MVIRRGCSVYKCYNLVQWLDETIKIMVRRRKAVVINSIN